MMLELKSESFYRAKNFVFLYPSVEEIEKSSGMIRGYWSLDPSGYEISDQETFEHTKVEAMSIVSHLRTAYHFKIDLIEPQEIFFVIQQDFNISIQSYRQPATVPTNIGGVAQIICGEKIGWICPGEWMKFEEVIK